MEGRREDWEVKHPSSVGVKGQGNPHGRLCRHTVMYAHTHTHTHTHTHI